MKKLIIASILLVSAGLLPSCHNAANTNTATATLEHSTVSTMKDLGTAD